MLSSTWLGDCYTEESFCISSEITIKLRCTYIVTVSCTHAVHGFVNTSVSVMEGGTASATFRLDIKGNTNAESHFRVERILLNLICSDYTTGE